MTKSGFRPAVYARVRKIPSGRVATYGQIAAEIGHPGAARAVGTALAQTPRHLQRILPWHRVIASHGVSRARDGERAALQRELLRDEGVAVRASGHVDLLRFQWNPSERQRDGAPKVRHK